MLELGVALILVQNRLAKIGAVQIGAIQVRAAQDRAP